MASVLLLYPCLTCGTAGHLLHWRWNLSITLNSLFSFIPAPPVSYISYLFSILSTSVLVQTHLSYFSSLLSGLPVSI